jgi:hypothetical protein
VSYEYVPFSVLKGKTIKSIVGAEKRSDEIHIECTDGSAYLMGHDQDCCETVDIEDVCGNINDLIGAPILQAEERVSKDGGPDYDYDYDDDSHTWTFYSLATIKGYVDIRWLGTSNGYYSESVDMVEVEPRKMPKIK